jgi:hypothetical protein
MQDIPLLLHSMQYFFLSHTIGPTGFLKASAAPHFKTSKGISELFSEVPNFSTINNCVAKVAI